MYFRMRTSKESMEILKEMQDITHITPNILARLAIALSLRDNTPIGDKDRNNHGLEFHRHILTGNHDLIFKCLISQHCGRYLSDEEYFPVYIKRHLDRGAPELKKIYDYSKNTEKFMINLSKIDSGVLL
ncbi:MAG TPA: DndE family protein [Clostridia bacterium]